MIFKSSDYYFLRPNFKIIDISLTGHQMKGSKSAHAIASCEVYAEVVDAAGNPDDIQIVNQKRQSYHSGGHLISTNRPNCHTSRSK